MAKRPDDIKLVKNWLAGLEELNRFTKVEQQKQNISEILDSLEDSFQYAQKTKLPSYSSGLVEMHEIMLRGLKNHNASPV